MKDWLLSVFGNWFLQRHFSNYGHMTSFHIDTENKKITVRADLQGETSPIDAEISYATHEQDGNLSIAVTGIQTSREWMTEMARAYLAQAPVSFPVPPGLITTAVRVLKV